MYVCMYVCICMYVCMCVCLLRVCEVVYIDVVCIGRLVSVNIEVLLTLCQALVNKYAMPIYHYAYLCTFILGANILQDGKGNVKVADFGVAKQLQTISKQYTTRVVGTDAYMAPEVMLSDGDQGFTCIADIW